VQNCDLMWVKNPHEGVLFPTSIYQWEIKEKCINVLEQSL